MDILTLAKELGNAIQQSEEYIDFRIKEQNVECDTELQKEIEEFNLKKVSINHEISKEDTNQEKIDNLNSEISDLYSKIMSNETMQKFNESKQKFENILKKINLIISGSASGQDPETIDVTSEDLCGGNCSACSGCN
ncbi:MAG: YlbF family regulator [Acutalibacteraceae bacterium]